MEIFNKLTDKKVVDLLRKNRVGVIPTDTIYGVVASAFSPRIVEKVYTIKERDRKKPLIVLVSSRDQIKNDFEVSCPDRIADIWPAKLSVVLPVDKYPHLHRGGGTIAFRVPDKRDLRELIRLVGPIVAPSANKQGENPAKTIKEAQNYFGNQVDFYVDGGFLNSKPSTLVSYKGELKILRNGAVSSKLLQ